MAVRLTDFTFRGQSLVHDVFIETGTYHGETLDHALDAGFNELHSIEFCEANYRLSLAKFEGKPQVRLHLGSSPEVLPRIIDPRRRTTFWLDAHYQGSNRAEQDPEYGECPLLAELRAIFSEDWSPIVLIDDAHVFIDRFSYGFDRGQWPTIEQIRQAFPANYDLLEHHDILFGLVTKPSLMH